MDGEIGDIIWFCGEYIEDFYVDLCMFVSWCIFGMVNGMFGDFVLYMVNVVLVLMGLIVCVMGIYEIVYKEWFGGVVDNDDYV